MYEDVLMLYRTTLPCHKAVTIMYRAIRNTRKRPPQCYRDGSYLCSGHRHLYGSVTSGELGASRERHRPDINKTMTTMCVRSIVWMVIS